MPEQESIKKPAWSFDLGIISNVVDMMKRVDEDAYALFSGNGNKLISLESGLKIAYMALGGSLESEGNLLDPLAMKDIESYFVELKKLESVLAASSQDGKIMPDDFMKLKSILEMIMLILHNEVNRLFVRFVTIYSEEKKMSRYSTGRTEPPEVR